MQHLKLFENFDIILEKEQKGFFPSMWSVLTLGGYVTSKLKNAIGIKSALVKNKISKIEDILKTGLQNLTIVFPSQRYIESIVNKNDALKRVKDLTKTNKVNEETYNTLNKLMFEIDKAILIYEEDRDLNLMKEEIEKYCDTIASNQPLQLQIIQSFEAEINNHVKNLRLNKKIVEEMTHRLPRYELKNLALEASIIIKSGDDYKRDSRLSLLFQKSKNNIYTKYEKYYDFDELNNWLDYERFDPSSVKYREQIESAKKASESVIKNNKITSISAWQTFKPLVGSKYYFFYEEDYEWRALLVELIAIDNETNTLMYKPYGIYRVNKKDKFEFKRMFKKEIKNSPFTNIDFIGTNMYVVQNDKMIFIKDEKIFSKSERVFKFNEVKTESDLNDIVIKIANLRGLGVFKIDESVEKIDTDNWKKYEVSNFQMGLNFIKKLIKQFYIVKPKEDVKETSKDNKVVGKYGKYAKDSLKVADEDFLENIYNDLFKDFAAASKTMGSKMKDDEIHEYLKKYLKDNIYKLPRNYESILSAVTKSYLKRKK